MLLTTGERVSMALMSMALRDLNCPAISFTGSQAGILTTGSHFGAHIIEIKPQRILEALDQNQIVIVAGFQGVDPITKEITTLGSGGSDTTAVALAATLKAKSCDLLKDVESLYSADPKVVNHPKPIFSLTPAQLNDLCFWGAKVLHHRSVELALRNNVLLRIGSSNNFKFGTVVTAEGNPMNLESQSIIAVNSHNLVDHIEIQVPNTSKAMALFGETLMAERTPEPQVLALSQQPEGFVRLMYTSDSTHLSAIQNATKRNPLFRHPQRRLSSVTMTCFGSVGTDLATRAAVALDSAGISIDKMIAGPTSLTYFVNPEHRESAIKTLHRFVEAKK